MTELDRRLAWSDVRPFTEYVEAARSARRFAMVLAAAFAVAALLLTGLGARGVTAYGVAVRRRELGVRQALGASPRAVARLVTGEVARLLAAGLLIGLAVWLPVRRATRVNPAEALRAD
jgi:ABC-type antimicrobial peptide transport system permease subunit